MMDESAIGKKTIMSDKRFELMIAILLGITVISIAAPIFARVIMLSAPIHPL